VLSLSELPQDLVLGVALALGLTFGSFLNVVIYRLPRGESLAWPGSHCPACARPIAPYDNLPVLSFLLLRGRARCCGARISGRYPLVEALGGLYAWALVETLVFALPGDTPAWRAIVLFLVSLAMGLGLLAAAFIDLEHFYLPDPITLGGIVLGVLTAPLRPDSSMLQSALGAAVGFLMVWLPFGLLYRLIRGKTGMGLGDAKLLSLAGAWFGWQGAVFALLAGSVQGTLATLAVLLTKGKLEEPEAVSRERQQRLLEIDQAEGAERERLEAEFLADPVLAEPSTRGIAQSKLAFGPFLVLAILEYQLFARPWLDAIWMDLWMGYG